jgi:hypothetical protein
VLVLVLLVLLVLPVRIVRAPRHEVGLLQRKFRHRGVHKACQRVFVMGAEALLADGRGACMR